MVVISTPSTHRERAIEWLSSAALLGWGITLALPGETLMQNHYVAFRAMGWSEAILAWVFCLVGAARLVALYINGRWPKSPIVRIVGAIFGALIWGQVAYYLAAGTWMLTGLPNTGVATYAILAAADIFSITRAAFDARYHRS
jgi:hypothetical protein